MKTASSSELAVPLNALSVLVLHVAPSELEELLSDPKVVRFLEVLQAAKGV